MIPVLLEGPALEPVSLVEAKSWLRVDGADEDDLIRTLIVAARLMVEAEIGQVLIAQSWRLIGDRWPPGDIIPIRIGRVLSVNEARTYASDGDATPIAPSHFEIVRVGEGNAIRPLIRPMPGRARAGIEIDLRLGFGEAAADVPETLRIAIRRLVALWFEERGDGTETIAGVPSQIRALIRPFRRVRL